MLEDTWIPMFTEVGAFAMVAWLVYYTFSTTLPQLHEEFRKELQEERKVCQEGFRQITRALERLTTFMLYHDASVRGQTPETDEIHKLFQNGEEADLG